MFENYLKVLCWKEIMLHLEGNLHVKSYWSIFSCVAGFSWCHCATWCTAIVLSSQDNSSPYCTVLQHPLCLCLPLPFSSPCWRKSISWRSSCLRPRTSRTTSTAESKPSAGCSPGASLQSTTEITGTLPQISIISHVCFPIKMNDWINTFQMYNKHCNSWSRET